ncbi:MAG: hypothetical protein CMJ58_06740 [Planctomycetaceae bacterium]|nr:hypothetical protein [Planctomycetaceae bacterium]
MSHSHLYECDDMDYQGGDREGYRRSDRTSDSKSRRPAHGRKRGKSPQSVNGIHRRRRRKMSW